MPYSITQIEDATVEALEGLKNDYGVRTIMTYQEELTEDNLKRLAATNQLPAVFVVYAGSRYADHGSRKVETISLALFFACQSLFGDEEARRGGQTGPGVYAIMAAVRDCMTGRLLLPEMHPVEIVAEEAIWLGNGVSLYGANYETAQGHRYPAA